MLSGCAGLFITFLLLFIPAKAFAHVKWFVENPNAEAGVTVSGPISFQDPAALIWTAIVIVILIVGFFLDKVAPRPPKKMVDWGERRQDQIRHFAQLLVGVPLLISAARGNIIAPHLLAGENTLIVLLALLEGLAAILLIANLLVPFASSVLVVVLVGLTPLFGSTPPMEYMNILGVAVYFILMSVGKDHQLYKYRDWSIPILRVIVGITLITLGLTEKLLRPDLALQFLDNYDMNFMSAVGLNYPDFLFVISAGFCEVLFGLVFLFGIVTRINTLSFAVFLVSSNTYFFVMGLYSEALKEIIGHSLLFAAALLLIVYGGGGKLKLPSRDREPARVAKLT